MRMSRFVLATIAGLLIIGLPQSVRAQQNSDTKLYRWGIGWDDGIGMRYVLSDAWGLGFRLKPTLRDEKTDWEEIYTTDSTVDRSKSPLYTRVERSFECSAMLFREVRISRFVSVGPYAGFGYERRYIKNTQEPREDDDGVNYSWDRTTSDIVFLEAGIRPTFEFFKRFVLETRLGFVVEHTDRRNDSYYRHGSNTSSSYRDSSSWTFSFSGRDLGPGAVMQFMIFF